MLTRVQRFRTSEKLAIDGSKSTIKAKFVHFTASVPEGTECLSIKDICRVKEYTCCPSAGFVQKMLNKTEYPSLASL